jgi:hypothetical protein
MLKQICLVANINMKKPRLIPIEIAFTNSRQVDLATLDSTLPHIHSYQLQKFLYPRCKNLRVKVVRKSAATAYSMPNSEAVGEIYSYSYVARINGVGRMWQK